ncbi:MAG: hypothetical protein U9R54_03025 [Bacteroidota bacterium]|nr:hypothetical protein [Bacteroidota bacterium]
MIRSAFIINILIFISLNITAQNHSIENMTWEQDFKIHLTLANDSNYILDVQELHHSNANKNFKANNYTYYPVKLNKEFISRLKKDSYKYLNDSLTPKQNSSNNTLWSALHSSLGGEWIHFINCFLYSLETNYLNITAPLLERPDSKWKPKPITESYKRTKKWDYYAPVNQRYAIKEYEIKLEKNELGNLKDIPDEFIQLFLNTNNKEYRKMQENNNKKDLAKINMIKILLGANYLGKTQIKYIKSMVLKSISKYSKNQLPSIIILDNFNAAVAMNLNERGYNIEKIVFSDQKELNDYEISERKNKIKAIITHINSVNKEMFQQKLKRHYN